MPVPTNRVNRAIGATSGGTTLDAPDINAIAVLLNTVESGLLERVTGVGITAAVKITQANYDALNPKVATTLYLIEG